MLLKNVKIIFDRRKTVEKKGKGKVEFVVYLSRSQRKVIGYCDTTPRQWRKLSRSKELFDEALRYQQIVGFMEATGKEMSIATFNELAGFENTQKVIKKNPLQENFLEFMEHHIMEAQIEHSTRRHHYVVLRSVERFGRIKTFADLTPSTIMDYDTWLRNKTCKGKKIDATTIDGYHKRLKRYIRIACCRGILENNPYDSVRLVHGKSKERKPLLEQELLLLRQAKFDTHYLERARDLFIFAAYTGLAYVDVMHFDFSKMTEEMGGIYYIDGKRGKTGSDYYTPILPPAMEALEKYQFILPQISNQKVNLYLHSIQIALKIKKKLTFHVARHSFATMMLSHDVPIEKVARMLGHHDIKTTQIYAKILKNTIQSHADRLFDELM